MKKAKTKPQAETARVTPSQKEQQFESIVNILSGLRIGGEEPAVKRTDPRTLFFSYGVVLLESDVIRVKFAVGTNAEFAARIAVALHTVPDIEFMGLQTYVAMRHGEVTPFQGREAYFEYGRDLQEMSARMRLVSNELH